MSKRLHIILILLLSGSSFVLRAQTQSKFIKEAIKALDTENYAAALEYYSNALEFDSDDLDLAYKVAESARLYHSYTIADSLYKQVIEGESDGNYPEATFWRATVLREMGQYEESTELYQLYLSEHEGENVELSARAQKDIEANEWALSQIQAVADESTAKRLDENVNTPYSEFGSYIKDDSLYFSSLRFEREKDKNNPPRTYAKILLWQEGEESALVEEINDDQLHTAHTTFSLDGDRLYYTLCDYVNDHDIRCHLYYRSLQEDGSLGEPVKLPASINQDSVTSTEPSIGIDPMTGEEVLYFVSDREGGKGGLDIWMTKVAGDDFSEPMNVESINSERNDITPQYHRGTASLFFSSEGYVGFGGYDVFQAYQDPKTNSWSSPQNLGHPINSSYNDVYFFLLDDGVNAYVSSNRPGSLFLEEEKEACCYDIYETTMPYLKADLIAQTFLASYNDTLQGVTVSLYPVNAPHLGIERMHQDSFSYRFPLKRNQDYILVAEKYGYLPDTVQFSTRDMVDTADIVKKLFLKTVQLDLLALVYDKTTNEEILGAEVTLLPVSNEDNKEIKQNLDGNDFPFALDRDQTYRIIASRKGYQSQSIVLDADDYPNDSRIIKKIYLPLGALSDFLPLVLYFDNDRPNPDTWARTTDSLYTETFGSYYRRKDTYKDIFAQPIVSEDESAKARTDIERFFETEVKKGKEDFGRFLTVLLHELEQGVPVNIYIKGYTSPRFSAAYNFALGLRRVESVKNELLEFESGVLQPYIKSGQLSIKEKSMGELQSDEDVIDDLNDIRNSIYSLGASKERRVEIINVDKE